jgi:hypothetical protein
MGNGGLVHSLAGSRAAVRKDEMDSVHGVERLG